MSNNIILDEILKLKKDNPNYELEAVINKTIDSVQFKSLAKFLSKIGFIRNDEPEVLDINFYTNNKKDNLSIRYSITGLDDIRNYCRLEKATNYTKMYKSRLNWPQEISEQLEKSNIKLNKTGISYNDNEYNYRINLKSEILPNSDGIFSNKIAKNEDNDLKTLITKEGYENIYKMFRFKKRTSFTTLDNLFRIDLTIVKSNKQTSTSLGNTNAFPVKSFKESNCLNEKEIFEVEVEYIGTNLNDSNMDHIKYEFLRLVQKILGRLFSKTYEIMSNTKSTEILGEYLATIRQMIKRSTELQIQEIKQDIDTPYNLKKTVTNKTPDEIVSSLERTLKMIENGAGYFKIQKNTPPTKYFMGPKPKSMNIENIQEDFPTNILTGFTVTDKADGETCILYLSIEGGIYMIDTNMNVYCLVDNNLKSTTGNFSTILIGEFIDNIDKPSFYCFDCYLNNLNDIRLLPLVANAGNKSRINFANEIIESLSKVEDLPIHLNVKKFMWNPKQTIFSLTQTIWEARDTYPYRLDGIIYTPVDLPVGFTPNKIDWLSSMGGTWNMNMKWKPADENTIDFLIHIEKERLPLDEAKGIFIEKDKIRYKTFLNGEKMELIPYKTIHLYCGFNVKFSLNPSSRRPTQNREIVKYRSTQFTPTNPFDQKAYVAHICCDEKRGNHIYGKNDNDRIIDNTIVEFAYEINKEANTEDEKAFRWVPLRTRVEKTEQYSKASLEKERIYKIYNKYRFTNYSKNYKWTQYEEEEIQELYKLIYPLRNELEFKGNLEKNDVLYHTLINPNNKRFFENFIQSSLDIPIDINYGNNFNVANEIWRSMWIPITDKMITTGQDIPPIQDSENVYYNRTALTNGTERSITKGLQEFHNKFVKNTSLYEVAISALRLENPNDEIHLLDLATGKAGDLYKWYEKKINFVVGIDNNANNIYDEIDGAYIRYIEFKKKMEAYGVKEMPQIEFLQGDVSLNIKSKKSMKTDDSIILQKKLWEETYNKRGFDIVSIMFAIHYMFENEGKLNGLLQNISENLRPGGYFIGTCFDGATIYDALRDKSQGQAITGIDKGQIIWKIKKRYENVGEIIPNDGTSLGLPIEVFINSINQSITEFLVSYNYLVKKMAEVHLEPIHTCLFREVYDKFRGELKTPLSIDEQRLSFLNRLFIFRKKSGINIQIEEAYNKLVEIKSTAAINYALVQGVNYKKWSDLEKQMEILGIFVDNFDDLKTKLIRSVKEGRLTLEPLRKRTKTSETSELIKAVVAKEQPQPQPTTQIQKVETKRNCGITTNPIGEYCALDVNENTEYCEFYASTNPANPDKCLKKKGAPTYAKIKEKIAEKNKTNPTNTAPVVTVQDKEIKPVLSKTVQDKETKPVLSKTVQDKETKPVIEPSINNDCGFNPTIANYCKLGVSENKEYCEFKDNPPRCVKNSKINLTYDKIANKISEQQAKKK